MGVLVYKMTDKIIQEIIDDLNKIPTKIVSSINIKKLSEEVSKELQKKSNRSFS